jgi:hypothetical protein
LFRPYRLLCIALLTLVSLPASAQYTRDTAANKKIDEAVNQHYVATDFEKAEGVLLGTINACADKCSPGVFARAWMYVGIVRGSGKNNQPGAKEAFQKAAAADPSIKLDMVLATPETQATFAAVTGNSAAPAPAGGEEPAEPEPTEAPAPVAGGGGGLDCTPGAMQVETRRPIPIQCQSDEEVAGMEIKYKAFGSDTWKTLPMQKSGDAFRATIPCSATGIAGSLRVYVRAKDKSGEQVDTWGTKQAPNEFSLAEGVTEPPPAFDGEEPPARCQEAGECPPDFPGCSTGKSECEGRGSGDWGAACENSVDCKCGLLCQEGTCETAPSCDTDADCSTGTCIGGKCDIGGSGGVGPKAGYKKNWLGLHFAQDFALVGGNNVCDSNLGQKSSNYACFYEGTSDKPFVHTPFPYKDGIQQGMVLATSRILLSYERAFFPWLTVGARAGFAFGGGPPAGQQVKKVNGSVPDRATGQNGTPFLPLHVEVRAAYWFLPLSSKLLRLYAGLGGGMAQVDAKVSIPEYDCTHAGTPDKDPGQAGGQSMNYTDAKGRTYTPFEQCKYGKGYYDHHFYKPVMVDGWKKMGQGFGTAHVGGVLAFKDNMGVQLNANIMYLLPASGLVIEPSLGFVYGL